MNAKNIIQQNSLSLKLVPISLREVVFLKKAPFDFYIYDNGLFEPAIRKNELFSPVYFKELIAKGFWNLFILESDKVHLQVHIQEELIQTARSLSMGNIAANITHQTNLLTLNMANLYNNPLDDELLKSQFQSVKNLSNALIKSEDIILEIFENYKKQKHYFILGQPMLSSLLLIGFLTSTKMFNEKEIEVLFATSYFKDIGMSFVPTQLYNKVKLTEADNARFSDHSNHSIDILKNRSPLHINQLSIIANHHCLNEFLTNSLTHHPKQDLYLLGIETILVSMMDVIMASTMKRPYRDPVSLFEILEILKDPLSKQYSAEFKALVYFLRRFFHK